LHEPAHTSQSLLHPNIPPTLTKPFDLRKCKLARLLIRVFAVLQSNLTSLAPHAVRRSSALPARRAPIQWGSCALLPRHPAPPSRVLLPALPASASTSAAQAQQTCCMASMATKTGVNRSRRRITDSECLSHSKFAAAGSGRNGAARHLGPSSGVLLPGLPTSASTSVPQAQRICCSGSWNESIIDELCIVYHNVTPAWMCVYNAAT
jgi:hypothetical protein